MQAIRRFRPTSALASVHKTIAPPHSISTVTSATASGRTVVDGPAGQAHFIKVVTYNILANKYAISGNHSYCPSPHLEWKSRGYRIQAELLVYAADIVCLQEVETTVFEQELKPFFASQGLQGFYRARQAGEVAGAPEGVALFINTTMFEVLQSQSVQFSDHAEDVAGSANTNSDGWKVFNQKEEGVIMAMLKHRQTGKKVLAASAHLFWNPRYPDVKVLQAAVLCIQLASFACAAGGVSSPSELAVVLGGDFNSLPCKRKADMFDKVIPRGAGGLVSGVYKLLQEGVLHPSHPDYPLTRQAAREVPTGVGEAGRGDIDMGAEPLTACGLRLKSMYHLAHGREPVLTTKTTTFAGCLDYIWVSPDRLTVEETLELPYEEPSVWSDPLADVNFPAIPDQTFPSDHLAMGCVLRLHAM